MLQAVDFTGVGEYKPVPANRYRGQTGSWSGPTLASNGKSYNIQAEYLFEYVERDEESGEEVEKKRTHKQTYNLQPQALWSWKRDMIALGADPAEVSGTAVDMEAIMNRYFGSTPTPIWLHLIEGQWTPPGQTEARKNNQLEKVELRTEA